jgi:hypothetical protein
MGFRHGFVSPALNANHQAKIAYSLWIVDAAKYVIDWAKVHK